MLKTIYIVMTSKTQVNILLHRIRPHHSTFLINHCLCIKRSVDQKEQET